MQQISSVNEYFDTLEQRFLPTAAEGLAMVFQWNLTGDNGCDYYATVNDGAMSKEQGVHDNPDVTITISADNYVKLINGKLNGAFAVMTRKLKVRGNVMLAKKMDEIFPRG